MTKSKKSTTHVIAQNKKARFDYFIVQTLEAGLCLQGWEVKSLRAKKVQLKESYIIIRGRELFLFGAHITPLKSASSHVEQDATRLRKLLLNRKEINHLIAQVKQRGMTAVPLSIYWSSKARIKLLIGISKGKKRYEKRDSIKQRDWHRQQQYMRKNYTR